MKEIRCPKCGSTNNAICRAMFREREPIYLCDCLDCDWFAAATTPEGAELLFERGGVTCVKHGDQL